MRPMVTILVAAFLSLWAVGCSGEAAQTVSVTEQPAAPTEQAMGSPTGRSPTAIATDTIELRLTAIDGNNSTDAYRSLLDSLQAKCSESRDRIGELAAIGQAELKRTKGKTTSVLSYLDLMNRAIPDGLQNQSCALIGAAVGVSLGR